MTHIVYLDQNSISTLCARLVDSPYTHEILLQAISKGKILFPLSFSMLDESIPIIKSSSSAKINACRQIINELFVKEYLINVHNNLLIGDVIAYANNLPLQDRKIKVDSSKLNNLLNPNSENKNEALAIVEEVGALKKRFQDTLRDKWTLFVNEARSNSLHKLDGKFNFDKMWDMYAIQYAHSLAERYGVLEQCKIKGMDGLLGLPSVRVYVGYKLSLEFSSICGRNISKNDSYDHRHAVQATAAHIFVTNDDHMTEILKRIPLLPYDVVNLENFLKWVSNEPSLIGSLVEISSENQNGYAKFC